MGVTSRTQTVAVLIPTYRPEAYIEACLRSLQGQTLSKDAFVVYVALNGIKQPYFSYLQRLLQASTLQYKLFYIESAGVAHARNQLMDKSSEPYIVFLDDDDILSANYLAELIELAGITDNSIVASNSLSFYNHVNNPEPNFITVSFQKLNKTEISKYKTRKYYSTVWAKMIPRQVIKENRFDERLSIGEDSLFMALISTNVHIMYKTSEHACYFVNERQGSVTRRHLSRIGEINRCAYLFKEYSKLLFKPGYNKVFILSRLVATLIHHLLPAILPVTAKKGQQTKCNCDNVGL